METPAGFLDDEVTAVDAVKDGVNSENPLSKERWEAKCAELVAAKEQISELEQRIAQMQKIDTIGLLASGIAHDFNNLLQVIIGHAEIMMLDVDETSPLFEDVSEIKKAALRATDVTRQVLAFSRSEKPVIKVHDLNAAIIDLMKLLKRILGDSIVLKNSLSPLTLRVKMDSVNLTQIVTNLTVNARDAMGGQGTILIETERVVIHDGFVIHGIAVKPGTYARLSFGDSGCGIPEALRDKIFEPFFTTKPVGSGTGMGLSIISGIVRKLGGYIDFTSVVGDGTTFYIYLPAVEDNSESDGIAEEPIPFGNGEHIIVIDDNPDVAESICRLLSQYKYDPLPAIGPEQAYSMCRIDNSFKLALCDIQMPGKNGVELSKCILKERPNLNFVFISGYMPKQVEHELVGKNFLRKPFSTGEILRAVRSVLDGKPMPDTKTK